MTDRIVYLNSELFYYKDGTGSKTILLFHGFGQDHRAFEPWKDALQKEYTAYAFDLFFHGNSRWENQQALKKEDWKKIMQLFIDREKIDGFEMAGFSMGAKFVLSTLELFPERTQKVILLAPDGIGSNFWYRLATSTWMMRALFRRLMLRPKGLQSLMKILKSLYLEDEKLLRFAEFQLGTAEKRRRVYQAWIYFRHLNFKRRDLTVLLNSRNIPIIFILGTLDNVVRAEKIKAFAKTLKNHQIRILDATHQDLICSGNFILKPQDL